MRFLAKGKRGITYLEDMDGEQVVVKEKNPQSEAVGTLKNEYDFLRKLNKEGIGPRVIKLEDNKLYMKFVSGELIIDFLERAGRKEITKVLEEILKQLRIMDRMGINKDELTYPYKHIIIRDGEPVMIDFERCRFTESPQNITQFCQFLISKRIKDILKRKGINISKEDLLEKAKEYKDSYSDKEFEALLHEIRGKGMGSP